MMTMVLNAASFTVVLDYFISIIHKQSNFSSDGEDMCPK